MGVTTTGTRPCATGFSDSLLGPLNKLLFLAGLLVGHRLSSCDRLSAGCKSPLTGGVKESNAGGTTALKLTHLGIKALIVEGEPDKDHWWLLHLSKDGGRFEPADDLIGLGVQETTERPSRERGLRLLPHRKAQIIPRA